MSTVGYLEGGVSGATVIILYNVASEFWKEVKGLNLRDPLRPQPLTESLPSESDLLSCPVMTRSTGQSKIKLLLPQDLLPPHSVN